MQTAKTNIHKEVYTMTIENFKKARAVNEKIGMMNEFIDAFEWEDSESRHPSLIVESDDGDGGREHYGLPVMLNEQIIELIKDYAKKQLVIAEKEFEAL